MTDEEIISLLEQKIYAYAGLNLAKVQKIKLLTHIKNKAEKFNLSIKSYLENIDVKSEDFKAIINLVTVNETYFFRERLEFEFLRDKVFKDFSGKKISIWSGACSTGEEPLSLYALAINSGVDATVYASDIDDEALAKLKTGVCSNFSFRQDGKDFWSLLDNFGKKEGDCFVFDKSFIQNINIFNHNLVQDSFPFSVKLDVILLRNVFIYFDKETRCKVIEKVSSLMSDGAVLILSMNEIGGFGNEFVQYGLHKVNYGSLYYFVKHDDYTEPAKIVEYKRSVKQIKAYLNKEPKIIEKKRPSSKLIETKRCEESKVLDLETYFEQIIKLINESKFEKAEQMVQSLEDSHETKAFARFFYGFIYYHADKKEDAQKQFDAAYMLKPDFWPSLFYEGLVLRDIGKYGQASLKFDQCMTLMDQSKEHINKYNFILDDFDPAYIYNLCKTLRSGDKS